MPTVGRRRGLRALCGLALGLLLQVAQGVAPSHAEECKYFSALPDDCPGAPEELKKSAQERLVKH